MRARRVRAGASLDGIDDAEVERAQRELVRREQEDRGREQGEHDEVDRAVDSDDPEHDLVAERAAAQRKVDLVPLGRLLVLRVLRRRERQPRIAAHTAVPANTVALERVHPVLRAEPRRVHPDQLMPGDAAHEQLPVEARAVEPRSLRSRRLMQSRPSPARRPLAANPRAARRPTPSRDRE